MSDEYEVEPIPGIPADLPEGENLLWQASPQWRAVARHVFHARLVLGYFAVLIGWRLFSAVWTGGDVTEAAFGAAWLVLWASGALGLVALLAWLTARTTIYSITSRRVLMRYGIALPMTINLPFVAIQSADLNVHGDGTGDIALATTGDGRLAYLHLWPHARAWYLKDPQPMMRGLANPAAAANLLSQAMAAVQPGAVRTPVIVPTDGAASPAPSITSGTVTSGAASNAAWGPASA